MAILSGNDKYEEDKMEEITTMVDDLIFSKYEKAVLFYVRGYHQSCRIVDREEFLKAVSPYKRGIYLDSNNGFIEMTGESYSQDFVKAGGAQIVIVVDDPVNKEEYPDIGQDLIDELLSKRGAIPKERDKLEVMTKAVIVVNKNFKR